jgi:hypothetical protein
MQALFEDEYVYLFLDEKGVTLSLKYVLIMDLILNQNLDVLCL